MLMSISVFLFANTKTGNGEITGSVANLATGRPIAGATISIPDLKITAVADEGGHYMLRRLPKGSYLVQITAIGFAGLTETVDLSKASQTRFSAGPLLEYVGRRCGNFAGQYHQQAAHAHPGYRRHA